MKINSITIKRGTLIRHKGSGNAYEAMVIGEDTVMAVRAITVTNPSEWDVVDEGGRVIEGHAGPTG